MVRVVASEKCEGPVALFASCPRVMRSGSTANAQFVRQRSLTLNVHHKALSDSNFIVFSDVHLGADLVQHVRPWTLSRLRQVAKIDRDLATMLDWYRENRDPDRPWTLVIAGDLVDFVGMNIAPLEGSTLKTELNDEERMYGLGSAEDHAVVKMRAVARRHTLVFDRLAAFVGDGHRLCLVRGNHDIDFHWKEAQAAFVEAMVEKVEGLAGDAVARVEFESRVEFFPWFYYVEGLLYVEHGHQFDAMCRYHHLLAPVRPHDPRRISWSFSDLLLRRVVRPTRGLAADGHDSHGFSAYVRFGLRLGLRGAFRLLYRYIAAITNALGVWRHHVSKKAQAIRNEHERKMGELSERMRIGREKLAALAAMWPVPVTGGPFAVLRSVFADLLLAILFSAATAALLVLLLPIGYSAPIVGGIFALLFAFTLWHRRRRVFDVDPSSAMRRAAGRIADLLPARWVVMGHTHHPLVQAVSETSTYVNLGNWGVDDLESHAQEAPRTHLVIRFIDGEHRAEFRRWHPENGPTVAPDQALSERFRRPLIGGADSDPAQDHPQGTRQSQFPV